MGSWIYVILDAEGCNDRIQVACVVYLPITHDNVPGHISIDWGNSFDHFGGAGQGIAKGSGVERLAVLTTCAYLRGEGAGHCRPYFWRTASYRTSPA